MRGKLTVLIPCKDESRNIRQCIESVRDVADEVLIADSGSTDNTLDIAGQIGGCRIIQREYINSADFKNWAIPQASHPWVFLVDADERATPELLDEIRAALDGPTDNGPPPEIDGFWIRRQSFFMGHKIRHCGWNPDGDAVIRLFRRTCRYVPRRVHAEIELPRPRTRRLEGVFLHYTYWSYSEYLRKYDRYTTWGAQDMWDQGKRAGYTSLVVRPMLRFFQLYVLRRGFLDGLAGLQVCMLAAFFNIFIKQAKLWEMEHVRAPAQS